MVFILILIVVVYTIFSWKNPPIDEIKQARINLTEAKKINSDIYAAETFRNAENYYDSAMYQWNSENKKISWVRDFSKVRYYADKAADLALTSIEKTKRASGNVKFVLKKQIEYLQREIELYKKLYGIVPLEVNQRKEFVKGKLLLEEGIIAYKKQDYSVAFNKLDSSQIIIKKILQHSQQLLEDYFLSYNNWDKWIEQTINDSRKHKTTCLIIDKYARKCFLYKNGILVNDYDVELGTNWIGHKNYQGDKSTPEGSYKIIKKKSNGATKYYKALLLDYPNDDDKSRFNSNKKKGKIRKDAQIGNMIEIHGHGGIGSDWTDGCIALKDTDMDKLFSSCSIGTKVTIIGSARPLNEILKLAKD